MKICFVSSYPPNRARLSEYAQNLVKELANRPGIDKIYLLADKTNYPNSTNENSKVEVLRVWREDKPSSILGIMPQILKLKPDVVHFNIHFQSFGKSRLANFTGLFTIFLCKLLGVKVLAEVHNLGEKVDLEKVRMRPSFLNRVGILIATKLILTAPQIVVTVRSYAEYLKNRYDYKAVKYIPHGAPVLDYATIDPEEKIILMFGHMGPSKGLPTILEAFEKLRRERGGVRLLVAGSSHPNFPSYLEEYIKGGLTKVEFLGYIPENELETLFRMSDLVVLPYFAATGTSGVFHIACGFGKPVVASDLPEIREMISDGASALLVPPGDTNALKDAIVQILFDEKASAEMREQNLRFARQESWCMVAIAYEETYQQLLTS